MTRIVRRIALASVVSGSLALTLAGCCGRFVGSEKSSSRDKAGAPAGPAATVKTFTPDARFLPVPTTPNTLRVVAKGGINLDVTTPPATLSDLSYEMMGEGARVFGINNHQGVGAWAIAGFSGAGEFALAGDGATTVASVDLEQSGQALGEFKHLTAGRLRVESVVPQGGGTTVRATAYGKAKTDSGKAVDVQFAFFVVVPAAH
jgi:hypothetical protein